MVIQRTRESASKALLPLAVAFFREFDFAYWAKESWDQAFSVLEQLMSTQYRTSLIRETPKGETVKAEFWIDNVRFAPPLSVETSGTSGATFPSIAIKENTTYAATLIGDFNVKLTLLESRAEKMNLLRAEILPLIGQTYAEKQKERPTHHIKLSQAFKPQLPILIRSKYCSMNLVDRTSSFLAGEDYDDIGGCVVIDGRMRYVGSIYSYRYNHPTCVKTDHEDQVVRIDIMFRGDVFYGNSYYMKPMIVHAKTLIDIGTRKKPMEIYDIIFELSPTGPDVNKSSPSDRSERINRVPIRVLFFAYGCTSDKEIIDFTFPGSFQVTEKVNIIKNAFEYGTFHNDVPKRLTQSDALLYIGEKIMTAEAKKDLMKQVEADAEHFVNQADMPVLELRNIIYTHRMIKWTNHMLAEYFMPNINKDHRKVCMEIGKLVARMINVLLNEEPQTDRTDISNKTIHLVGEQFISEFKTQYNATVIQPMISYLANAIEMSVYESLRSSLRDSIAHTLPSKAVNLFRKIKDAIKTPTQRGQPRLLGEDYDPKSLAFVWSKIREITIRPNAGDQQASVTYNQRKSHQSYGLIICPDQTPEAGEQVGRYHQPALYCVISVAIDPTPITELIYKFEGFKDQMPEPAKVADVYEVLVNFTLIGIVPRGKPAYDLWAYLLDQRQKNSDIDFRIGISIDHYAQKILINTESGRACVPLIKVSAVHDTKFKTYLQRIVSNDASWYDGFKEGFLEYCDTNMLDNCTITEDMEDLMKRGTECTHLSLPVSIVGLLGAINPAMDRNRGVRSTYLTNHTKQAIGWPYHNWLTRYITEVNIMHAPERPLVRSALYDILDMARYAFGQHCVIFNMSYAKNQEDSLAMSEAAADREQFLIHHIRLFAPQTEGNISYFGRKPYEELYMPVAPESAYRKVDPDKGIPTEINTILETGDVIAAKFRNLKREEQASLQGTKKRFKDDSEIYSFNDMHKGRHPTPGRVVASNPGIVGKAQRQTVMIAITRPPIAGDKFSNEQAQKGTLGELIPEQELPYTADGIRPTFIFNDASVLKRQTYGSSFIPIIGKVCAMLGTSLESTPFLSKLSAAEASEMLGRMGLSERGEETVYDGVTGRQYKTKIFVGSAYYIRQKHMVVDKSFVRSGGPREGYSRQATHGRKKGGGLKLGEMENDAITVAGAAGTQRDSFFNRGAPYYTYICSKCGRLAYPYPANPDMVYCDKDGLLPESINHKLRTPFNVQLLTNTLGGASIAMRTLLQDQS